ncbi:MULTISPECIES: malto-oligosyltrehalose synthase [Mycobacterium avium complex (MAC)]|uniref:Malto-oligosyltrehalose synthase n=2 Tax=Mycobacterium intracellulare TaxID=1767 RepID=A0AAE4UBL8_MYCIT|nr:MULTISPECIES: malto-oligosyltrehalose synthase [Mycobacterium avium complex (MAC)]AFS15070.1 Putative maltooligosyl trehalose synthase [Mycobacterium intracellulare subsp. intracellulare MTCC 9506]MCA2321629.1 malto-oligosyltrehalose synthase [Mycobacterium intracellulare]MCA2339301.1 malto-oligosyltrehalose synthase [Mycobacterium intracellulare]MDV6976452.1 malto-oligosyltrehalose synthase [Mycobacterium intracellulare]MDV6984581.1 malto-oligosyltrehalose synthase [Mycobacterium intracell
MDLPILSTYRLQLRGESSGSAFTFADAENLLDYLDDLGVTHLYLSPIMTATTGSSHGYDVTDPTTVSPELGGRDGLARLSAAARARGLGLVVDIVPNHVGIDQPRQNPWWWDVLRNGRSSPYATFFDIDWDLDQDGRIVLPVLGSDEDAADLTVDGDVLRLGDLALPIAPGTAGGTGPEVHDRQHYRLVGWRNGVCGYRRFFSITSLAGLRQEDRAVFDATHAEVGRWFAEGLVDGVRIDHPDGLSDPCGYLAWLRELVGPSAWVVIEKILAVDEALEPTLPVGGTTGYDVLREVGGLFVDPQGAPALTALVESSGVDYRALPDMLADLKIRSATDTLGSELSRLRRSIAAAAGADHPQLPAAVAALLTHLGVYRSDYPGLVALLPTALAETEAAAPELGPALQVLAAALARGGEPATRLQQLCGAVTAKSFEDCLFYRDARLISLNEVGGEPHRFGVGAAEFHHSAASRARMWPQAMTTLTTHDTKRGEDVRARIGVLSQVPSLWAEFVARWETRAPSPDPATGQFLWQNIFGVWPVSGQVTRELRDRLHGYAEKAIREAAWHTSWNDPDTDFEDAIHRWLDSVLDGPVAGQLTELVAQLNPHAASDALGQKLLALTVPGIPDVYQGTELWDDSLVDPDNRRPVDYAARRAALHELQHPKIRVVTTALRVRRAHPDSFLRGDYVPVLADGDAADHVVAFRRGSNGGDIVVAVTRWTVRLAESGWGNTVLPLPDGTWKDALTGAVADGPTSAAQLFADLPVVLLERHHD